MLHKIKHRWLNQSFEISAEFSYVHPLPMFPDLHFQSLHLLLLQGHHLFYNLVLLLLLLFTFLNIVRKKDIISLNVSN
uniref:Uncharacterized protein n=1 Tax=Picea glauca TaxID=3330 RepID=A0A101M2A2_PICGL|nr:hypothetical protein ABT39_MTgene2824 [Picea glauca]QHR87641.1 hypothetical protein Q903MT_gene1653 [Picea sitchensis]